MAQRSARSDAQDIPTVRSLRSMGSGTDVLSMSAKSSRTMLPHARPPPAYVSDSEAEKLVYAETERPVRISESALHLVNGFLDQILYDILSKAHAVTLSAIRSAVPTVLKQRLGQSAVKAADEELQDYLDEDEMEEVQSTVGALDPKADFDVDLAWKITRLRCMVYAKLGDMEEEDEEDYLDDDELREHASSVKESARAAAAIAPSAAIFLTTVLEFLGEQALCIAAQHAKRRQSSSKSQIASGSAVPTSTSDQDIILLEDIDMSGVGKEGPLIRLWRSWKGSLRGGASISSRPSTPLVLSPVSPDSPGYEWRFPSVPPISTIQEERSPSIHPARSPLPSNIPLPMSENDVEEIEVPGLAPTSDAENEEVSRSRPTLEGRRPSSMLIIPGNFPNTISPGAGQEQETGRPSWTRRRSHSLPTSSQSSSGAQIRQVAKGVPPSNSGQDVMNTLKGPEDFVDSAPGSAETEGDSRPISNRISSTVATIAGALSVEASRVLRRDQPTNTQTFEDSDTDVPLPRGDYSAGHNVDSSSNSPITPVAGEGQEGIPGPEDLALSSGDEGEAFEEERTSLRDSGFGVAAAGQGFTTHERTNTYAEEGSTTASAPQSISHDHASVQRRSAADGTDEASLGTAAIFYQGTFGSGGSYNPEARSYRQPEQANVPVLTSIHASADHAGTTVNPARPAERQARTSSLEGTLNDPTQPPTQTSFHEHIPGPRQAASEKMGQTSQDRVPRYATSSFATTLDRHEVAQAPQARHASAGKDGRPTAAGRPHVRLRSNSDEGSWRITPPDEMDRAKKSLDVLIDSDETLRITLTPKTARPAHEKHHKVKSQAQELADFFRNTAPPGEEASRPKSSRSAKDSINGLRSNLQSSTKVPLPGSVKPAPAQPSIQPPAASLSKPKNPLGEPRDPRMAKTSTRDLADYARSTGPENELQLPKPLAPRPGTAQAVGTANGRAADFEAVENENRPATTSGKPVNRLKYQARDARGPRAAESSDLIDFIREGPPRQAGDHRIDRNVAPFRTTMDSDDLNALAPPQEADSRGRNSVGSAQESAVTIKSMPSSMNSRTGLLDSTNRASGKFSNGAGSSVHGVTRQPVIPEAEGMPKRTQRRVRDPYAIEYSDEEDEMEEPFAPQHRRGEEESLVDFLRNTAPTPGMATKPILAAATEPTEVEPPATVNRSASNSKLRDYLGTSSSRNGPSSKPSNGPRAESPHLTQVGSKMDKYRPTQPTHAPHVVRNRQKTRAEPRDATVANVGGTSDLAAYLKNSGPPPGTDNPPQKFNLAGKDQAGFMRFFQKRNSVRK